MDSLIYMFVHILKLDNHNNLRNGNKRQRWRALVTIYETEMPRA